MEDDALLEKYLEKGDLNEDDIRALVRLATIRYKGVPVYCGASLRNAGVQPVIDGIVDFLPSPLTVPPSPASISSPENGGAHVRRRRAFRRSRLQDSERHPGRSTDLHTRLFRIH